MVPHNFLQLMTVLNISLSTTTPRWTLEYQDRQAQPGMMNACAYPCDTTVWRYHDVARTFATLGEALQFANRQLRDTPFERNPRLYVGVAAPMKQGVVGYDEVWKAIHVQEKVERLEWQLPVVLKAEEE